MVEVSTSILTMEKGKEAETLLALEKSKTDYFHIDVMDGNFVEKDTYHDMVEYSAYIRRISNLPMDVHLMVKDIETAIEVFSAVEPNIIIFHLEACENKEEVMKYITLIKEKGSRVGIAIKPETPIEQLSEDFLIWWPSWYYSEEETVRPEKLSCYGMCNEAMQYGFFSYEGMDAFEPYIRR